MGKTMGVSPITDTIYYGTVKDNKWVGKREDVTDEAIKKISQHYGYDAQSRQLIEEMAELTQAINKYWRKDLQCGKYPYNPWDVYMPDDSREYDNLLEEIADVEIMLAQVKWILDPLNVHHIDQVIEQKLNRQLERIGADERKP